MAGRSHGGGRSGDYLLNDRQQPRGSGCPQTWKFAVAILLICALFLIGVVIGYCISQSALGRRLDGSCELAEQRQRTRHNDMTVDDSFELFSDPRQMKLRHGDLVKYLLAADYSLPTDLIEFSTETVHSGSGLAQDLTDIVSEDLWSLNLDKVATESYQVLVSKLDEAKPNIVRVFYADGSNQVVAAEGLDISEHKKQYNFAAYSPSANITAELVYLNYGTWSDFETATSSQELGDKVALVRSGKISLEHKISVAVRHGMVGLLVFEDRDFSNRGHKRCSSHPPRAVIDDGFDPLSPNFPASEGTWLMSLDKVRLVAIPVATVSCQTAKLVLLSMNVDVESSAMSNVTRAQRLSVQMAVNTKLEVKLIDNIIATIYGQKDSDYSVLIGASRSGWDVGTSMNATHLLLTIARGLSQLFHNAADLSIPKYSVRLVSWGGADINQRGITEFIESYSELWRDKLICYIDLDDPVTLRHSISHNADDLLHVTASPSLHQLVEDLVDELQSQHDRSFPLVELNERFTRRPVVKGLVHSEQKLQQKLGVPYLHVHALASSEDNSPVGGLRNVSTLAGLLAVTLADSGVVPLRLMSSVHQLQSDIHRLLKTFTRLVPNDTAAGYRSAIRQLRQSVTALDSFVTNHLQYHRADDVRMVNTVSVHFDSLVSRLSHTANHIMDRYHVTRGGGVVVYDRETVDSEVLLASEMSELLSGIRTASQVISLAN